MAADKLEPHQLPTDEALVALVALGDRDAFSVLYDRYARPIYVMAAHMLGAAEAEDVVQNAFLQLWTAAERFRPERGSFRAWFMTLARYRILDELQRRSQEQRLAGVAEVEQILAAASTLPLPPEMKERLLASLPRASSPGQGVHPLRPRAATRPDAPDAGLSRPVASAAQPRPRRGRWLWSRARTWSTLAATVVLLASLVWSARLSAALAQERKLAAGFAQLVGQQETVLDVVDSPQTVRAVLRSPTPGSPSYGKLYTRHDMAEVVVMAARLATPPSGQAYHLWLTRQGRTQLAGVLLVNSQGFGLLVFDAGQNDPRYDAAEITLQSEGAIAPIGAPILLWKASAGTGP